MIIDWKLRTMWDSINGVDFCGINKSNIDEKFQFGDYILWFPKDEKTHLGKFKKR
jgi:hypothetical protein